MLEEPDQPEWYQKYIEASLLYCRASIAMYQNLMEMMDKFGTNTDTWAPIFQQRIDSLAVSLYQLTRIEDDPAQCLPMDISSFQYKDSVSADSSSSDLQQVWDHYAASIGESSLYFIPADYDGDGVQEAFAITGVSDGSELYEDVKIYYINSSGDISCVRQTTTYGDPLYGFLRKPNLGVAETGTNEDYLLTADKYRFLVWEISAYGSGSVSVILGARNNTAYEPNISTLWGTFRKDESGNFVGTTSDFSTGVHQYLDRQFTFDAASGQFIAE